jgi:hypothetical protein
MDFKIVKYYAIDIVTIFPNKEHVLGHANGKLVPNGSAFFERMDKGEIINDAPVLDYFYLESFGRQEDWEWRLQDAHGFIGEYPASANWYISDRFKNLLENFQFSQPRHFYPTKLLYKGQKLDYWILQYGIDGNKDDVIDFNRSEFLDEHAGVSVHVNDFAQFDPVRRNVKKTSGYKKDLATKKLALKQAFDFVILFGVNNSGKIVSEKLKKSIEDAGLKGLEFKTLPYEVEIA